MEYSEQIRAYRQEFLDSGNSMDGTGGLSKFDDPRDWIVVGMPDTIDLQMARKP